MSQAQNGPFLRILPENHQRPPKLYVRTKMIGLYINLLSRIGCPVITKLEWPPICRNLVKWYWVSQNSSNHLAGVTPESANLIKIDKNQLRIFYFKVYRVPVLSLP